MARRPFLLAALSAVAFCSAGCGSAPPKPAAARALITASGDVNPNPEGRASPVHVRVYQLKEEAAFMEADYWTLSDKAAQTLGPALLQTLERDVVPGGREELELKIEPDARVLAVMAEFSDYRNAEWRTVVKAPQKSLKDIIRKDRVTVTLEQRKVSVSVGD